MSNSFHPSTGLIHPIEHYSKIVTAAVILVILTALVTCVPARADIAPPEQPPGSNPVPGSESTQVQMVSETVTINVLKNSAAGSLGQAQVTALFHMCNQGSVEERMEVRFPLSFMHGWSDGFGRYPEITDLRAKVDGRTAYTRRITTPNPGTAYDTPIPWSAFDVTFPPGKDVQIEVSYTANGFGQYPFVSYRYVFETGAAWKDSIESAELIVRLPYEADSLNVIFDEQIGFSQTTSGGVISGREIRWVFEDFEPKREDNFQISLVMPEAWQKVLIERENVKKNPRDGEAWGRLGKAYKEIARLRRGMREDEGGPELHRLSVEAYEQAVTLLPKDALWHFGFADTLWYHCCLFSTAPDIEEAVRAVHELKASLDLDPRNQRALDLLQEINYDFPGAIVQSGTTFTYPILTATPVKPPTSTPIFTPTQTPTPTDPPASPPTITQPPSPTPQPPATDTPDPTSVEGADAPATAVIELANAPAGGGESGKRQRLPMCGSTFILPAIAIFILSKKRKSR